MDPQPILSPFRQLTLLWSELTSPLDELPPAEEARVVACLAQMLLEASGAAPRSSVDEGR